MIPGVGTARLGHRRALHPRHRPGSGATIYGSGFSTTASQNVVHFGKKKVTIRRAETTSLQVTIPTKAKKGSVGVYVVVNGKNSSTVQFTVK